MKPGRPHRRWSAERPSLTPDTLSAANGPQTRETKGAAIPCPRPIDPLQPPTSGAYSFPVEPGGTPKEDAPPSRKEKSPGLVTGA